MKTLLRIVFAAAVVAAIGAGMRRLPGKTPDIRELQNTRRFTVPTRPRQDLGVRERRRSNENAPRTGARLRSR